MNGCTTCNQSVTDSACIPTQILWYFLSRLLLRPDMIDREIISNLCDQIWLCNRSLDGCTLQLQSGGRQVALLSHILALDIEVLGEQHQVNNSTCLLKFRDPVTDFAAH